MKILVEAQNEVKFLTGNDFEELKTYNVDISRFVRDAVKEKIQRDWKNIKEEKDNFKYPF